MSFNFKWPKFSKDFHADAATMLDSALNRGPKPKVIADDIKVEDINMGNVPPDLEILEIGELSTDRFRGIFRLTYAGDAHLTLSTKVQANPLSKAAPSFASSSSSVFEDVSSVFPSAMPSRGILFAARPLIVPMKLRLSSVRLRAIVVLVVSKQKGITLVFKNDPLESVEVSSTFDSVAVIQKYLQQEIEAQLREMFREDLPGIIHRLSQRWLSGQDKKDSKSKSADRVAPTPPSASSSSSAPVPPPVSARSTTPKLSSSPEKRHGPKSPYSESHLPPSSPSDSKGTRRRKSSKLLSASPLSSPRTTHRGSPSFSTSPRKDLRSAQSLNDQAEAESSRGDSSATYTNRSWESGLADEMEQYDPTYGLRPDEVRMSLHGKGFGGLARLTSQLNGGLRDLAAPETSLHDDNRYGMQKGVTRTGVLRAAASEENDEADSPRTEEHNQYEDDVDSGVDSHNDSDEDDVPDRPSEEGEEDYDSEQRRSDSDRPSDDDVFASNDLSQLAMDDAFAGHSFSDSRLPLRETLKHNSATSRPASERSRLTSPMKPPRSTKSIEYETIPAVGGGVITRPRIFHTASQVRAPEIEDESDADDYRYEGSQAHAGSSTARGPPSSRTYTVRGSQSRQGEPQSYADLDDDNDDEYITGCRNGQDSPMKGTDESPSDRGPESLATLDPEPMDPHSVAYKTQLYRQKYGQAYRAGYNRQSSTGSMTASSDTSKLGLHHRMTASTSRSSTAPTSTNMSSQSSVPSRRQEMSIPPVRVQPRSREHSHSSAKTSLPSSTALSPSSMTLGASHHFMDLVNSNHTLSPFTRTLDTTGFAVRSHPVTPSTASFPGEYRAGSDSSASSRPFALSQLSRTHSTGGGGDYFRTQPSASERAGKNRTFKLGGSSSKAASSDDGVQPSRRPDLSPVQKKSFRKGATSRADTADIPYAAGAKTSASHALRQTRVYSNSDRAVPTMGSIRE